jgi:hypothetical protein
LLNLIRKDRQLAIQLHNEEVTNTKNSQKKQPKKKEKEDKEGSCLIQ